MKVEVLNEKIEVKKEPVKFPCLMHSIFDNEIILAYGMHVTINTEYYLGVSLIKKPGWYSETWTMSSFEPHSGKVVLQNE